MTSVVDASRVDRAVSLLDARVGGAEILAADVALTEAGDLSVDTRFKVDHQKRRGSRKHTIRHKVTRGAVGIEQPLAVFHIPSFPNGLRRKSLRPQQSGDGKDACRTFQEPCTQCFRVSHVD